MLTSVSSSGLTVSRPMSGQGKLGGKVALVTASTEGIGYGIAQNLASHGASVMICSRKVANVDAAVSKLTSEGHSVSGVVCHVGKKEDRDNLIQETVAKYGGLDILVSNAAVNPYFGSSAQCWNVQRMLGTRYLRSMSFLLFKECVPHMKRRGGGSANHPYLSARLADTMPYPPWVPTL